MKQVLDKPDPCSMYENYQRQEGFPVGKQSKMKKVKKVMFCKSCFQSDFSETCVWRNRTQYKSTVIMQLLNNIILALFHL